MLSTMQAQNTTQSINHKSVEISVKGKWVSVPSVEVGANTIVVRGRWLKIATIQDEAWLETEVQDPEGCVRELKGRGRRLGADIFTFSQKPSSTVPRYRYCVEWDSVAAIRLSSFKDWWDKLPQESRKNVRRSQKRGVEVKIVDFNDDLVRLIRDVHNDSPVRQGVRNVYYGKSIEEITKDHSAFLDRSDFIGAFHGNELIGFEKVVYRGEVGSILNFVPKASQSDKRPANALIAKAVEVCIAKGVNCLTYGMLRYGNKRESPLQEFKERNGFEEVLVPRFYVPVSRWGALCMKFGLHRGLLGILPPKVITLCVSLRVKWYDLRQSMGRCSSVVERSSRNRQTERSNPPAGSNN